MTEDGDFIEDQRPTSCGYILYRPWVQASYNKPHGNLPLPLSDAQNSSHCFCPVVKMIKAAPLKLEHTLVEIDRSCNANAAWMHAAYRAACQRRGGTRCSCPCPSGLLNTESRVGASLEGWGLWLVVLVTIIARLEAAEGCRRPRLELLM